MTATAFWLCFVPLFVAVDAIGILPMFMNLTEGISEKSSRRLVVQSVITAMAVALLFLAVGELLLRLLGISIADFMIAGGVLLFAISLSDLLTLEKPHRQIDPDALGAVPIGVPLIVGPAVLTTTLLLLREYGYKPTIIGLVLNVGIAGIVLWFSQDINKVLGKTGAKTVSKLASLLLAAIGVMMVRKGVMIFLR
jgi:membrane protein, MarC family